MSEEEFLFLLQIQSSLSFHYKYAPTFVLCCEQLYLFTPFKIKNIDPKKVEKVGYDTFRNAVHLKVIEFPSTLKFLGNQSLFGCTALRAVAFRSTTPPKGMTYSGSELEKAENALDTDRNNRVRLFIPIGSATAYQTALNTNSKFRYLKGAKGVNWYTGDTHQAIVDIANFDKVDFSKL